MGQAGDELTYARRLLEAESGAVRVLGERLGPDFSRAVDLITRCADSGGNVLVSGLGKSGLVGQKISATLASLAVTSHFVHPAEAAHGDLGRFRANDLCIALSYSGETDEVVALAIGDCDDPEISPAPTCSTTAMLALGDALALCAARRRNFTDDDFAKRHPGGSLGGLLRPVVEILRFKIGRNLEALPDSLSVAEALARADAGGVRRPGALLLVDQNNGRLTGLFTDGDLRRLVVRSTAELARPIRELMTRNPTTLNDSALVRDAVRLVRENRRDEVPIVDAQGRPVGVLDVQDLIAMKLIKD